MQEDLAEGKVTVSFEEPAYSNMIVVGALVELLTEKGLLSRLEIEERMKALRQKTKVNFRPVQ